METLPDANSPRPAQPADPAASPVQGGAGADRERRRGHGRPQTVKGTLTILDGPAAGTTHEVLTRDLSPSGVSFLLREGLAVDQPCHIAINNGRTTTYMAEVVRSRPLSTGKHEM